MLPPQKTAGKLFMETKQNTNIIYYQVTHKAVNKPKTGKHFNYFCFFMLM